MTHSPPFGESLPLNAAILLSSLLVLNACSSSSSKSSPPDLTAQAVDGYIVNATVFCDGVDSGTTTGLAGVMSCPAGTDLFGVSGGIDVGFNELEDEDGVLFLGTLSAPTSLEYVTPVSTILVELAKDESGVFDPAQLETAEQTLEAALGSDIDLNADASTDLDSIKLNAQLQEVMESFVDSTDDYSKVVDAFAKSITNAASTAETIDLVNAVDELLVSMNTELVSIDQNLAKDSSELDALVASIAATNFQISRAQGSSGVTQAAKQPAGSGQVLTINRDTVEVTFGTANGQGSSHDLMEFESDARDSDNKYSVLASHLVDSIGFNRAAVSVNSTVSKQPIELGFELDATEAGDTRKLSVTTSALLSMNQGDNASIDVDVPAGSVMNVTATDSDGTRVDASFKVSSERSFSSSNGFVSINLTDIEKRLADNDITGFLDRSGNYQVTMVVGGVRIAETVENVSVLLSPFTVSTTAKTVSGTGFRGYASFYSQSR
ncbi:MAG: hypothetical protein AB8B63_00330 [Granulosicoccus sp.]